MEKTTCELCDDHAAIVQVVDPVFRSYGGVHAFRGPIATVKCHEDNSRVRELVDQEGHGRVLVVDGGGSLRCALLGDQLAAKALARGWRGIVVYGAVRDVEILGTLSLGIQALGVHPMKSLKKGVGEQDIALHFAGVHFVPGHYLYADVNGIVVAPHALS
jgi:regulator of ribonuclease activity A